MIKDSFDRIHDYLRISLTDHCNLRCFYCMPEEDYDFTPSARLMQPDEILTLAKIFVAEGVSKIRLTGGEPLVRKGAASIISALGELPVELTMTTNGFRLHEFLDEIRVSAIKTINISLDTLRPDKYLLLTKRDFFHQVRSNIELMLDHGFGVKINMVVMKGINEEEINDFIAWTAHAPLQVRFIEFMPFTGNRWTLNKVFTLQDILAHIGTRYEAIPVAGSPNDTAKHFIIAGHAGSFSVISTMSAPFCGTCNRMRLTADGKLKNCLFSVTETDLLAALRGGEDVVSLIHETIWRKAQALGGQFANTLGQLDAAGIKNRAMVGIGG